MNCAVYIPIAIMDAFDAMIAGNINGNRPS